MTNENQSSSSQEHEEGRISPLEMLSVLAQYKRSIVGCAIGAAVLSAGLSMLAPNMYKATANLLPPQANQSTAAAVLSQLGGMAGAAAGAAGLKNPNDLYIGMLRSRTVADRLIEKFGLRKVYGTALQESARRHLKENSDITSSKDGLMVIEVLDEDRQRAAGLANGYVTELLRLTKELAVTEASQRRVFYEQQLEAVKDKLSDSEIALKRAMDKRGVISVDAESQAMVATVGRLKAQISAKEIQLNSMKAFVTDTNPDYRRVAEEVVSLRAELAKLENGEDAGASLKSDMQTSAGGLESIKLLRNVKYFQMLYQLLAKQYEVARLDEAKEPSVIQVLDSAVVPEMKAKPNRPLIVMISTFVGFFIGIASAFIRQAYERSISTPLGRAKWDEVRKSFRRSQRELT